MLSTPTIVSVCLYLLICAVGGFTLYSGLKKESLTVSDGHKKLKDQNKYVGISLICLSVIGMAMTYYSYHLVSKTSRSQFGFRFY